MSSIRRYSLVALAILALLGAVGPAGAAVGPLNDQAHFFSQEAKDKANLKIQEIARLYHKDLRIDTIESLSPEQEAKRKEEGNAVFFRNLARQRAEDEGIRGVYVLICRKPGHLEMEVDRATRQREFTYQDRDELAGKMLDLMKKDQHDAALLLVVDTVASKLHATMGNRGAVPPAGRNAPVPVQGNVPRNPQALQAIGGNGIFGWICLGVVCCWGFGSSWP